MNCKTNRNGWRRAAAGLLAGICLLTSTGATALAANAAPGSDPAAAEAVTAAATPETATPETALGPEAQAFVDAVNALGRESILAAVRQWAIASAAWQADPDNAELEAALNEAIAASDAASAPVYAAEDLYYVIPEEEQQGEEVQAAYTALAALIASMQLAMEQPELPEDTGAPPDDDEIYDVLYGDLPDRPTGSYIGSMGLPIATGQTRISISEWVTDLYDGVDAHIDAGALHADGELITVERVTGEEYAVVPIMVQVEYPANGSTSEIILPEDIVLLDYEGNAADAEEAEDILHAAYTDTSAAARGIYVQAAQDFTAEFVYTAPDGAQKPPGQSERWRRRKPDHRRKRWYQHLCGRAYTALYQRQDHLDQLRGRYLAGLVQRHGSLLLFPRFERSAQRLPDIYLCLRVQVGAGAIHAR